MMKGHSDSQAGMRKDRRFSLYALSHVRTCVPGSGLVSSGPVVDALENIDTSQAKASNPCDRRQIMNHIAGEPELKGIMVSIASGAHSRKLIPVHVCVCVLLSTVNTTVGLEVDVCRS